MDDRSRNFFSKVQEMAKRRYDPAKDPRLVGGRGYAPIRCRTCEDEGVVYFSRPGRKGLVVARCTCSGSFDKSLPVTIRTRIGKTQTRDIGETKTWREIEGLQEEDLIPSRLVTFTDEYGRLELGDLEPIDVQFRREGPRLYERANKEG